MGGVGGPLHYSDSPRPRFWGIGEWDRACQFKSYPLMIKTLNIGNLYSYPFCPEVRNPIGTGSDTKVTWSTRSDSGSSPLSADI